MYRLDKYLNSIKPEFSRTRAVKIIKDGRVKVNSKVILKPSFIVSDSDKIEIEDFSDYYVSRGGLKLESALDNFTISVKDLICLDIGASTGGFTECLIRRGASKVYALDVGSLQLDKKLRNNPKIISLENTNARYINTETLGEKVDFVCVDVSFISLTLILPVIKLILKDDGESVLLVKPQFELEKSAIGKNGVVKKESDRQRALNKIRKSILENGFKEKSFMESPIKGTKGNVEYLLNIEF